MKKILILLILAVLCVSVRAQSKQVKRYLEQIAANSVYRQYLEKAITIARTGLTAISTLRKREFRLHDIFINELSSINPEIRDWAKVAGIISFEVQIVKSYKNSYARLKASGQFSDTEIDYLYTVFSKLLDDCAAIIDMLADVLTAGTYKMSDSERIRRIDLLYANMQSNYRFSQQFSNNNSISALQRMKEQNDAAVSKKLFNTR